MAGRQALAPSVMNKCLAFGPRTASLAARVSPPRPSPFPSLPAGSPRRLGNGTRPAAGVVAFLNSLRSAGLRVALATSASRTRTLAILADLSLTDCFDAIVTGDEVPAGKPDPLIYRLAAERIREEPEQLLAIEDAVSGVKAKSACRE